MGVEQKKAVNMKRFMAEERKMFCVFLCGSLFFGNAYYLHDKAGGLACTYVSAWYIEGAGIIGYTPAQLPVGKVCYLNKSQEGRIARCVRVIPRACVVYVLCLFNATVHVPGLCDKDLFLRWSRVDFSKSPV